MKKRLLSILLVLTMVLILVTAIGITAVAGDATIISVVGSSVENKYYDGNTDATVNAGTLDGVAPEDEVILSASGSFDNSYAGEDKDVTVSYQLSGKDAWKYELQEDSETKQASILPKEMSSADGITISIYEGGSCLSIDSSNLAGRIEYDDLSVEYDNCDYNNANKSVTIYFSTSCFSGADAGNYDPNTFPRQVTIKLAAAVTIDEVTVEYSTFKNAWNAAQYADTATVKLLDDVMAADVLTVASGKNITIDLNGHVLKYVADGYKCYITNNGTLTVKDSNSTATHTGTLADYTGGIIAMDAALTTGSSDIYCVICNTNKLTIDGGTLIINATGGDTGIDSAICVYGKGNGNECEIKSGTFEAKSVEAIAVPFYVNGGKLTVFGGTLNANGKNGPAAGVYTSGSTELVITGGKITAITENSEANGIGAYDGKATISGCEVKAEGKTESYGIFSKAALEVKGGTYSAAAIVADTGIACGLKNKSGTAKVYNSEFTATGNTAYGIYLGDTMTVGGSLKATGKAGIYLPVGKTIILGTKTEESDGNEVPVPAWTNAIGITTETKPTNGNPVAITGANSADYSGFFTSDDASYSVIHKDNKEQLSVAAASITKGETTTYYDTVKEAVNAAVPADKDTVKLLRNVTENVTIESDDELTLDLNNHILKGDGTSSVIENNGTLTIKDSATEKTDRYFEYDRESCCMSDLVEDEYLIENYAGLSEGFNNRFVKTSGGVITGGVGLTKDSVLWGGGIFNNGALTLDSGNIVGNTAKFGGGVLLWEGSSFIMNGGTVKGNSASADGAGVFLRAGSTFTMNTGATIAYNTANTGAGGVYAAGTFTMNGGEIIGNSAGKSGAGVYVYYNDVGENDPGSFTMNGGTIKDNTAEYMGGGVYADNGVEVVIGGNVIGNSAVKFGGGIFTKGASTTIKGAASVKDNKSDNLAVVKDKTVTLDNFTGDTIGVIVIAKNTSNVYAITDGAFTGSNVSNISSHFVSDDASCSLKNDNETNAVSLEIKEEYKWYYDDSAATSFTISNVDELEAFAHIVNGGMDDFSGDTVKLSADYENVKKDGATAATFTTPIGKFEPIGYKTNYFRGTFDGSGKTVKLNVDVSSDDDTLYAGMFGKMSGAALKNINVDGTVKAKTVGSVYAGGLAGSALESTIEGCTSSADVSGTGTGEYSSAYIGGLVGDFGNSGSKIINSSACGSVTEEGRYCLVGGLIGNAFRVEITNCYAACDITVKYSGYYHAGGLAGELVVFNNANQASITNCYSASTITATATSQSVKTEDCKCGGVVGGNRAVSGNVPGTVTGCYYLASDDYKGIGATDSDDGAKTLALTADQMKAAPGAENADWADITVDSTELGKVALVDALNKYVKTDLGVYTPWKVTSSYPELAPSTTVFLVGDKAYSVYSDYAPETNVEIPMPAGIVYDGYADEHDNYTFTDVNLPLTGSSSLVFLHYTKITLKGNNVIGLPANYETDTCARARIGISVYDTNGLKFTGDGNLTIYDTVRGIDAGSVTFDNGFTGTVTINDYGESPECGISASDSVTVNGGKVVIRSAKSNGISSRFVYINGGKLDIEAKKTGILASCDGDSVRINITKGEVNIKAYTAIEVNANQFGEAAMNISGGKLTAEGSMNGIVVKGTTGVNAALNITEKAVVKVKGEFNAIEVFSDNGTATLNYGELPIEGATCNFNDNVKVITNKAGDEYVTIGATPCVYTADVKAGEKAQLLIVNGKEAGEFIISGDCKNGFTLKNAGGEYLALVNGEVKTQTEKFTWKYDGGLYTETKTTTRSGFWFWSFTTTKVTKTYLTFGDSAFGTSSSKVSALVQVVADEHDYKWTDNHDGTHTGKCRHCNDEVTEDHDFVAGKCTKCGALDETVCKVTNVKVTEKKVTSYSGFWFFKRKVTKFQYTLEPEVNGVTATKVEYSGDRSVWNTGRVFTSDIELESFYIRVTDSLGHETVWEWNGGEYATEVTPG